MESVKFFVSIVHHSKFCAKIPPTTSLLKNNFNFFIFCDKYHPNGHFPYYHISIVLFAIRFIKNPFICITCSPLNVGDVIL